MEAFSEQADQAVWGGVPGLGILGVEAPRFIAASLVRTTLQTSGETFAEYLSGFLCVCSVRALRRCGSGNGLRRQCRERRCLPSYGRRSGFYQPELGTFLTHDPLREYASPYA
ncbi:MAG: hypothetical protein KatS3mg077_2899 [Candidatus Binatia bacterium]|nr:MAG: hypothetical protein KatS3mg077_2899 [Candidatus Binatia bacterium]